MECNLRISKFILFRSLLRELALNQQFSKLRKRVISEINLVTAKIISFKSSYSLEGFDYEFIQNNTAKLKMDQLFINISLNDIIVLQDALNYINVKINEHKKEEELRKKRCN